MGILRRIFGLIAAGPFLIIVLAVAVRNEAARRSQCLFRKTQGVGTHVGNETNGSLPCHVNALIEHLGNGHGAPGRHAQLPGCFLLER